MFIPHGPFDNNPLLAQMLACRQPGDKPLSEPMMVNLLTHLCVTLPQWVKKNKMIYLIPTNAFNAVWWISDVVL